MSIVLLTVAVALTQLSLGGMGVFVSLKPPQQQHHKYWIGAFVIVGLLGVGVTGWLANNGETAQQQLKDKLDQSLLSQRYTQGQLDSIGVMVSRLSDAKPDPQLGQLAIAITDMAKVTRKQAENAKASNSEIVSNARKLAKQISDARKKFNDDLTKDLVKVGAGQYKQKPSFYAMTEDQQKAAVQQFIVSQQQAWADHQADLMNMYFVEARYLRDVMIQRLQPEQVNAIRSTNADADRFLQQGGAGQVFPAEAISAYLNELAQAMSD